MNRRRLRRDPDPETLPANDFERAADLFQWIFYLDWFAGNAQRLIPARVLADALRNLRHACCQKPTTAAEVRLAWQMFYDCAGPFLTGQFLVSGAWKHFCPDPRSSRDTGSMLVVWEGDGHSVVARVQFFKDEPSDIAFAIE